MTDLETFLCTTFSLESSSQISKKSCKANGTQSIPGAYQITKNEGDVVDIFVKTVHAKQYKQALVMEKEEMMYNDLITKVIVFTNRHSTDMGDQIRACFAEHYGLCQEKSGGQTLVLEDFNSRPGNFVQFDLTRSVAVVKKLGFLNAIFLAWQQRCNPGYSRAKMNEVYPASVNFPIAFNLPELKKYANGKKPEEMSGFMFELMTSVVGKIIRVHLNEWVPDRGERDLMLFKLERFVELSPNFPLLVSEVRNMDSKYTCPILGDVHPSNIAVSANSDDVIFFDFGLSGYSSALMDFHWFVANAAGSQWTEGNVKWLFEYYVTEFMLVAERLGMELDREDLFEEFHTTKIFALLLELNFASFGLIWKLKTQGVSADKLGQFIHAMIELDADKDKEKIREEVQKVLGDGDERDNLFKKILSCIGDIDDESMGEFEDIIDAYMEKQ